MSARSQHYTPNVLSGDEETELEQVREKLLERGLEDNLDEKNSRLRYSGSRFEFIYWDRSVLFRDYGQNKAGMEDLQAWEVFTDAVEEDLKYPPE